MERSPTTGRAAASLSAPTGERAGVRCRNPFPPKGKANFGVRPDLAYSPFNASDWFRNDDVIWQYGVSFADEMKLFGGEANQILN